MRADEAVPGVAKLLLFLALAGRRRRRRRRGSRAAAAAPRLLRQYTRGARDVGRQARVRVLGRRVGGGRRGRRGRRSASARAAALAPGGAPPSSRSSPARARAVGSSPGARRRARRGCSEALARGGGGLAAMASAPRAGAHRRPTRRRPEVATSARRHVARAAALAAAGRYWSAGSSRGDSPVASFGSRARRSRGPPTRPTAASRHTRGSSVRPRRRRVLPRRRGSARYARAREHARSDALDLRGTRAAKADLDHVRRGRAALQSVSG